MAEAMSDEAEKKPSSKLPLIIISILLLAIMGGGAVLFLSSDEKEGKKQAKKIPPAIYFTIDKFVVNVGEKTKKYLQVSMDVMARDQKTIDALEHHMPRIKNNILFILSNAKLEDISKNEGKEKLRKNVLKEIGKVIKKEYKDHTLEDVFFTSFITQ